VANRGAWAIAAMFGVGLLLAGGSVLYHSGQGRRCLAFYGPADAATIRHATMVEAWRLEPLADDAADSTATAKQESLTIDGQPWRVVQRVNISQARGLVHARHALIVDANYRWEETASGGRWSNALAFSQADARLVLLFDFATGRVRELDATAVAQLVPTIAAAEQALIDREFSLDARR
jgi:hypothetical protein